MRSEDRCVDRRGARGHKDRERGPVRTVGLPPPVPRINADRAMILVIDNYDSFTYNLVHYLIELGTEVEVVRNDAIGVGQAMSTGANAILLSPGPCTPNEAGISLELIAAAAEAKLPLFGVCLGHQAIGQAFGGTVVRADKVMHGKTSPVSHDGSGVFAGLPSPF